MKKSHVLFLPVGDKNWIGGVYYARNIIFTLMQNRFLSNQLDVDIICCKSSNDIFSDLPIKANYRIRSFKSNKRCKLYAFWRVLIKPGAIAYSCMFKVKKPFINAHARWIPDFQHNYYPHYFSQDELNKRTEQYIDIANSIEPIILSSNSAKKDFERFYSKNRRNVYVVPFVSYIEPEIKRMTHEYVQGIMTKYGLKSRNYVFIANQFWQHKNHRVVFEMLALANKQEKLSDLKFVFTGELNDHRNPEYVYELKKIIEQHNLNSRIDILGLIDRLEQLVLMRESLVLIQPSLFEGWGTVVEDGKTLDKTIILSDIPVHREQMNVKCHLFNPKDPSDLLKKLEVLVGNVPFDDIEKGIKDMYGRAELYSKNFEELLVKNMRNEENK